MNHPDEGRNGRVDRACLIAALVIPIVWFFVYDKLQLGNLCDEGGHLTNVVHIYKGLPGWPEDMTMLPGYHFIVYDVWRLWPSMPLHTAARLVSTGFALLGLIAFAAGWRQIHGRHPGRATLLFSLFPVLQPFTGMAYTDVPAIALVLLALGVHLRGNYFLAMLLFAEAAYVRQTNLLWAAFVVAWEGLSLLQRKATAPSWAERARIFFRRTGWLILLLLVAAGIVLKAGRVMVGTQVGAAMKFNIATVHTGALLVMLFGAPLWLRGLPAALRGWWENLKTRPALTLALSAAGIGAAVYFTLTYANPHGWNRDLFWPDASFTLLRNWPLVWIDQHAWLRVASGINIVAAIVVLGCLIARQPQRLALVLSLVFGAMLPAANSLVEPRYFIPMAVFLLLWSEVDAGTARRLTLWWAVLCLVHAPFIVKALSLW